MYVLDPVKGSINLSLKCLYGGFSFFYYLSESSMTYQLFNNNQIFLMYAVNCCSNYTNIVSYTIHAGIPCIFWFIYNNKNFLQNVVWLVVAYKTFVLLQPRENQVSVSS